MDYALNKSQTITDDSTFIEFDPAPVKVPAKSSLVLGTFKVTVNIVRTDDESGTRWWVDTLSSTGRPTGSTPFTSEREAMLAAIRLGI